MAEKRVLRITSGIMNRSRWGVGAGSVLLGLGLGGFFDGIVLHQILQWHHMLSAVKPIDKALIF
jgi:uncharacterized membrane protein